MYTHTQSFYLYLALLLILFSTAGRHPDALTVCQFLGAQELTSTERSAELRGSVKDVSLHTASGFGAVR